MKEADLQVAIIGLGLMGGSLALSLRDKGYSVVGLEIGDNAKKALDFDIVDEIKDNNWLINADVVILAMPIQAVIDWLKSPPQLQDNVVIIDLCSIKKDIVNACGYIRKNLVAAHPMCGTEYSGPQAAIRNLYDNKTVVLCDIDASGELQQEIAKRIFTDLNMNIVEMSAGIHDKHAAFISHLPHLLSFTLANAVMEQESPSDILIMAAGGFKDMSRLAKSSPELWTQIFFANKDELLKTLEIFESELAIMKNALIGGDKKAVTSKMRQANGLHQLFNKA